MSRLIRVELGWRILRESRPTNPRAAQFTAIWKRCPAVTLAYNAAVIRPSSNRDSSDRMVAAMVERFHSAREEKERMPQRKQLVQLIESGKHVLIGAKALAYYTKPRFTEHTDYPGYCITLA